MAHARFRDLPRFLQPGDVVVVNDSRVIPARLRARKESGGAVELLFLHPSSSGGSGWEALARPSRRLREGMVLHVDGAALALTRRLGEGQWLVETMDRELTVPAILEREGELPLPPYIQRRPADTDSYQTVYAGVPGSAAAPTAGLHFTPELLAALEARQCRLVKITLHIGLDTFRPITEPRIEDHRIHREFFTVSGTSLAALAEARPQGRRIVAVGTTSARVLETIFAPEESRREWADLTVDEAQGVQGTTGLYIIPGYRFRAVDVLITNFHLPRTSLVALVMAFAGVERIRESYREAVAQRYRFFSFGDAMLLENPDPPFLNGRDACRVGHS